MNDKPLLEYGVSAERLDAHGSLASCKEAELLLAALAGCMIKGIERVTPMLHFQLRGVQVVLRGLRQDAPPRMARIEYTLTIDTDESDRRLELLHQNVIKYGTVYNTLAAGTELAGKIRRAGGSNR